MYCRKRPAFPQRGRPHDSGCFPEIEDESDCTDDTGTYTVSHGHSDEECDWQQNRVPFQHIMRVETNGFGEA